MNQIRRIIHNNQSGKTKKTRRNHDDLNPCERLANSNKRRGRPRPNNEMVSSVRCVSWKRILTANHDVYLTGAGPSFYYRGEATSSSEVSLIVHTPGCLCYSSYMIILIGIITNEYCYAY